MISTFRFHDKAHDGRSDYVTISSISGTIDENVYEEGLGRSS